MRTRFTLAAVLVAMLITTTSAHAADTAKVQYALHLKAGQTFGLKLTANTKMTQSLGSKNNVMNESAGFSMLFVVNKVDADGSAVVRVTYGSVSYTLNSPTERANYDSTKPGAKIDPLAAGLAALAGQSFTMRLTSDGRVSDVQGVEKIMERADALLADAKEPIKSSAQAAVRQNCGPQATLEKMEELFNIYPTAPVAINERWSRTHVSTMGMPCYFATYSKVIARKDGTAGLKLYTDVKPNTAAPAMAYGDTTVRPLLMGNQDGSLTLEESTGLIIRGSSKMQLTGKLELSTAGKTTSYPVAVAGTSTVERF